MKEMIKQLLREGLYSEETKQKLDVDTIVKALEDSEDTVEPQKITDNAFFEKQNGMYYFTTEKGRLGPKNIEEAKRILEWIVGEANKGENLNLKKYKTEKIKGNQLKIGDVYARTLEGTRYIFKVLSGFRRASGNPNFFVVDVEVMDVGNQVKLVSQKPGGGYSLLGYDVGDKIGDRFKNKYGVATSNKVELGDVIRILNFDNP